MLRTSEEAAAAGKNMWMRKRGDLMKNCKHESLMRPVNLFLRLVCVGERGQAIGARETQAPSEAFYVRFNDLRELRDCSGERAEYK